MKGLKKFTAAALCAAMAASMTGCADASWIAKSGNTELPVGVYVSDMLQNYMYGYMYEGKEYLKNEENVAGLKDNAKAYTSEILTFLCKANELGVTLTEEEKQEAIDTVEEAWVTYGSLYETNRISKESMQLTYEVSQLSGKVFEAIYGEGGEKEVPADEIKAIYDENYLKAGLMIFAKPSSVELSEDATEEEKAQVKETYETSLKELQDEVDYWVEQAATIMGQGNSFNDVIIAYDFENTGITTDETQKVDTGNRYSLFDKKNEAVPAEVVEYLETAEFNEVKVVENDEYFVICCRQDEQADPADFEAAKYEILYNLKNEEMLEYMAEYEKTLNIEFNEAAIKRFEPKKLVLGY